MTLSGTDGDFELTPQKALIISLLYLGNSDGDISQEDISQIAAAACDDADVVDHALEIARSNDMPVVLKEIHKSLTPAQKRATVVRMIKAAVSVGKPNRNQWAFIHTYSGIFGISNEDLDDYLKL